MNATHQNSLRQQAGASLIEALVALVILSVGMLGIAGLYLESIRANRTALSRTIAVQLVNDMADRIRSNRGGLGDYTLESGNPPTGGRDCSVVGDVCAAADLAMFDKVEWHQAVVDGLPNGPDGTIRPLTSIAYTAATGTSGPRYLITAQWREPGNTDYSSAAVEVMQLGVN